MTAVIFVGPSVRRDKLHLIQLAGATVFIVRSSYEDAVELSRQAAVEFGWADRNTGHNPKTFDGKKTAAFEIWEQLGYVMPDVLIAPVGDGTTARRYLWPCGNCRIAGQRILFQESLASRPRRVITR